MSEGRKASTASKSNPPLAQGLDPPLVMLLYTRQHVKEPVVGRQ